VEKIDIYNCHGVSTIADYEKVMGPKGAYEGLKRAIRAEYSKQFCGRCDYCQPCPQGINIQMVMGLRSLVKRFGPQAKASRGLKDLLIRQGSALSAGPACPVVPTSFPSLI